MRFSLRRDILNKDVSRQEPRRSFGRAIDNKVISLLYDIIPSVSFNRLPHNRLDGDTRIWHVGSTQKQAFGSSKFHPDLASSTSNDDAQESSLRALQESADAFQNPYLTSARVEQSKQEAQTRSQHSLKVLETLAEAVGHDPFNIPPLMLDDIRNFEKLLLEIRTAMERPMERGRTSRLFRLNRRGNGFNDFDERLSELQQNFEDACSQRSRFDTPFVSAGASRVPPDTYSHTLESNLFRCRFRFSGLKSRLDPVSSTCADVASTTLKVLEKPGSSVPILNGVVSGISALLDTAKRVKQSKDRAQALLQHSATLAEDVDHGQSNMPPLMLERVRSYEDELSEVRAAMVPITERGWISRLFRLNRNEDILDTFNRRLNEAQQRFMVYRVEVTFQKHTADSLVCPSLMTILPPIHFS
ncbi:hypothetical protein BGY98DRAFT_954891 [Russula aff. rugulosa BPL654]|nr:hypothetical protein BGY98DRAFT_954891 [Russula aff. rugulosa BPL654]